MDGQCLQFSGRHCRLTSFRKRLRKNSGSAFSIEQETFRKVGQQLFRSEILSAFSEPRKANLSVELKPGNFAVAYKGDRRDREISLPPRAGREGRTSERMHYLKRFILHLFDL